MIILVAAGIGAAHLARLRHDFPGHEFVPADSGAARRAEAAARATVLLAYGDGVDDTVLARSPRLDWLHLLSTGIELLPLDTLLRRGITVTTIRGLNASPVSEYVLSMILAIVRRTVHFHTLQESRQWESWVEVGEACGRTVGIFGTGAVGTAIALRARAFGMRVIGKRRTTGPADGFDEVVDTRKELCERSDFVVLALPHTARTNNYLGRAELRAMRPDSYLINVARGAVVDEAALLDALTGNRIAGAVLDVFTTEPLPGDHPFWSMPNVIVTPHASGRSPTLLRRSIDLFADNLRSYPDAGRMVNVIDLRRGY